MRDLGLEEWILPCESANLAEIRKEGEKIARELSASGRLPDAIQTSDYMAAGLLAGFAASGVKVPDDIAVLGFDDRELAGMLNPPLTTLAQPSAEVGRISAKLLIERMDHPDAPPETIRVPMHLVTRESV